MNKEKGYTGIDYFRCMAAFLVIAIHTSPLSTYTESGDFLLTRIVSRVAVPFFLMTSGFFLISPYAYNGDRLKAFIRKNALIYGISIIIYIPLNIYNEYFSMDNLMPNMIKDILFDGTMYHLWYLPAAMMGAALGWVLVRKAGFKRAMAITLVLYGIGLLGDSYYGIIDEVPLIKGFYDTIFEISDYTRNGIFFTPVFLVMGGRAAAKAPLSLKKSLVGFGISFLLMLCEGLLLHEFDLQRHDSMYLFLPPCMYCLFSALTYWRGIRKEAFRTGALVIYIIHPMMIVAVRLFARLFGLEELLIYNSLVHYLAVSIAAAALSILFVLLLKSLQSKRKTDFYREKDRAWIEINLHNLRHNVKMLHKAMPEHCELMAVVKANAYGHGLYEIAVCMNQMGERAFAVATIDEGIKLRQYGIRGEILILGCTNPARAKELHRYDLTQSLIDYDYALKLSQQDYKVKVHIKIDTGMHRLGFDKEEVQKIAEVFAMKNMKVCGIYTHLCAADSLAEQDICFTNMQLEGFYKLLELLRERGIRIPKVHIQSSYGLLNYPHLKCDYVRAGVSLYGVLSSPNDKTRLRLDLRPVLSLKARVILLREVRADESVGYSRGFVAKRNSLIAMLSIGYGDGFPRNLSFGKGYVLINGYRAPIVGKICMDQLAVDVTEIPHVKVGMTATLIGKDGKEEISAPMVAENAESITNELLSGMGQRLSIVTI